MKECPRCGEPTTMWSRDLTTGRCNSCVKAEAQEQAVAEQQREQEALRQKQTVVVAGKVISCPICGHNRFTKQETLMNTRAATIMNLDAFNAAAKTCICLQCGYVLWFRSDI